MTTNHAMFFIHNGPKSGMEPKGMEVYQQAKAFWTKAKQAGDIAHFESVILASSGNQHMPAGFTLVTGDRAKLQKIRWENEEFLKLHTMTMMTYSGYACIEGYAGESLDKHLQRFADLMKK
jgi:hypothetical protein